MCVESYYIHLQRSLKPTNQCNSWKVMLSLGRQRCSLQRETEFLIVKFIWKTFYFYCHGCSELVHPLVFFFQFLWHSCSIKCVKWNLHKKHLDILLKVPDLASKGNAAFPFTKPSSQFHLSFVHSSLFYHVYHLLIFILS